MWTFLTNSPKPGAAKPQNLLDLVLLTYHTYMQTNKHTKKPTYDTIRYITVGYIA